MPASQTRDLPFLTQVNVFPEYVTFCFAVEHFVPAFGFAACANPIPTSESEAVRTRATVFLIQIKYHQGWSSKRGGMLQLDEFSRLSENAR
jgi:hypothetical protein